MLRNSQTKVIMPVILLGLLRSHLESGKDEFPDREIEDHYLRALEWLRGFLGHDVHIGARYYDAYGSRMSRYGVLLPVRHLVYRLQAIYAANARALEEWIPLAIRDHIDAKLGIVPSLGDVRVRTERAAIAAEFLSLVTGQIDKNAANFEVFSFAVIKIHLEKFACRLYRDTRTSAHDKGVDLSTNFGVVYQIKKLRLKTLHEASRIVSEIEANFDRDRVRDGNVILIIDDASREVRQYLINMKIQSLNKADILKLAAGFEEPEDRQKVLRIVYEEFRREYSGAATPLKKGVAW